MNLKDSQKGVAVYLAVVVMFLLLGIGIGLSTILIGQIRIFERMGDSVTAFYAADTGIERLLYEDRKVCRQASPCASYCIDPGLPGENCTGVIIGYSGSEFTNQPVGDASYTVKKIAPGSEGCPSTGVDFCMHSIGTYKGVRRKIEVSI